MTLDEWKEILENQRGLDPGQIVSVLDAWEAFESDAYEKSRAKDKAIDLLEHQVINRNTRIKELEAALKRTEEERDRIFEKAKTFRGMLLGIESQLKYYFDGEEKK